MNSSSVSARHDEEIGAIIEAIRQLMAPPEKPRREIGFHVREKAPRYRLREMAGGIPRIGDLFGSLERGPAYLLALSIYCLTVSWWSCASYRSRNLFGDPLLSLCTDHYGHISVRFGGPAKSCGAGARQLGTARRFVSHCFSPQHRSGCLCSASGSSSLSPCRSWQLPDSTALSSPQQHDRLDDLHHVCRRAFCCYFCRVRFARWLALITTVAGFAISLVALFQTPIVDLAEVHHDRAHSVGAGARDGISSRGRWHQPDAWSSSPASPRSARSSFRGTSRIGLTNSSSGCSSSWPVRTASFSAPISFCSSSSTNW